MLVNPDTAISMSKKAIKAARERLSYIEECAREKSQVALKADITAGISLLRELLWEARYYDFGRGYDPKYQQWATEILQQLKDMEPKLFAILKEPREQKALLNLAHKLNDL